MTECADNTGISKYSIFSGQSNLLHHGTIAQINLRSEHRLFVAFIALQLAAVLLLTAAVRTHWYSQYFNETMSADLFEGYRMAGAKHDLDLLIAARKFSSGDDQKSYRRLQTEEEMLFLTLSDPQNAKQHLQALQQWQRRKDVPQSARNLAHQKLLRAELILARAAIEHGNYAQAENYLQQFRAQVRETGTRGFGPTLRLILRYLDICIEMAQAQGNNDEKAELVEQKESMADPDYAKIWYAKHGIADYDLDYSADYKVQWAMQGANNAGAKENAQALHNALDACCDPRVPASTRLDVMQSALNTAISIKDAKLKSHVLKTWAATSATKPLPPQSRNEAEIIQQLVSVAADEHSQQLGCMLMHRMFQSYDAGLLNAKANRQFLESAHKIYVRLNETIPDSQAQTEMAQTQPVMEHVFNTNRLDDTGALLIKLSLLTASRHDEEAKQLADKLCERAAVQSDYAEQILFDCFMNLGPVRGNDQTEPYVRKHLAYLYRLRAKRHWSPALQIYMLLKMTDLLRELPTEKQKLEQISDEIINLSRTVKNNPDVTVRTQSLELSVLVRKFRFAEAGKRYGAIKQQYANDPRSLHKLCDVQSALWRAVPCYWPEALVAAKHDQYPYQCLRDNVDLTQRFSGQSSDEYSRALLWLAQYEYSRGNKSAALKYCNQIVQDWNAQSSQAYIVATDLQSELRGEEIAEPNKTVHARAGTVVELDCQRAIYSSLGNTKAKDRLAELKKYIQED
jgi:hypothetical protein